MATDTLNHAQRYEAAVYNLIALWYSNVYAIKPLNNQKSDTFSFRLITLYWS